MTTASESLQGEYERLIDDRTAAGRQRLKEILATPPEGYELPKQAVALIQLASQHGWISMVQWTPPGWQGEPSVHVHVGRRGNSSGNHYYKITWHSRDCAPGKLRLWSKIAQVPGRQVWHDAPSLTAIRTVIASHGVES